MKRILLISTLLLAFLEFSAAPVDVTAARDVALNYAHNLSNGGRHLAPAQAAEVQLIHCERNSVDANQAVYYIFNTPDSYIIVAGDDRAEAVLAYGDRPLDINDIPDGMRYWLGCYKQEIEYLQAHPTLVVEQSAPRRAAPRGAVSVEPLLTTLWAQSAPYNNQCPTSNGQRCVTGCGATSLSMILHYWRYPDGPTPSLESYRTESLKLTVNGLEPMTFDWENMLDIYRRNYSSEQANAVAWLIRYVGQAEHMDYTPSSSGVQDYDIMRAVTTFGFDSDAQMVYRENYSDEQWAAMIQEELEQGRPLEYCGYGGMSGHAFNVDGYDAEKDKYHINWGWGGSANGYCALNAFGSGVNSYNRGQLMIIGMQPPVTEPTIQTTPHRASIATLTGKSGDATITVKGRHLTGDVTLTLHDESGTFALSKTVIPLNELAHTNSIHIFYSPTEPGENTATVTLSSPGAMDQTITVTASAELETYPPEMVETSNVQPTSFQVNWNDNTPTNNVSCYNLEMARVPYSELSIHESFMSLSGNSSSSDCSSHLDDYTANAGWSGHNVNLGDGYLRLGNNTQGWLETPALDMRDSQGLLTVKVKARCSGSDTNALLKFTCGDNDTTLLVGAEDEEYCVLLPCPIDNDVKVRLTNSVPKLRVILTDVAVFSGDDLTIADEATTVCHKGIDGRTFIVDKVTPGTYSLRVQAVYTDGNISSWSNNVRVLIEGYSGDVNRDGTINIADINTVINVVLDNTASRRTINACDINGDGSVNIADISLLISKILQDQSL